MLLPVEGTLEAAEIEINPHEGMIPDVLAFLGSSKGYPATKGRAGGKAC
jgi:hypothetical protein